MPEIVTSLIDVSLLVGTDVWLAGNMPHRDHRVDDRGLGDLLRLYDVHGVRLEHALLSPFPSAGSDVYAEENAALARAAREGPLAGRASVAIGIRPGDPRSLAQASDLIAAGVPVRSVKLWPYMGGYSLGELSEDAALCEFIERHALTVFMHLGNGRERRTRPAFPDVAATAQDGLALARRHPGIRFLFGHVARLSEPVLAAIAESENMWLETSGLTSLGRWTEDGVDGLPGDDAGALATIGLDRLVRTVWDDFGLEDRVVFGSTYPFCCWWNVDPLSDVSFFRSAALSPARLAKLFSGNARRLLALR